MGHIKPTQWEPQDAQDDRLPCGCHGSLEQLPKDWLGGLYEELSGLWVYCFTCHWSGPVEHYHCREGKTYK